MGDLLTTIGTLGTIISLGLLIYALIIKWPVEKYLTSLALSLVALVLGFGLLTANDPSVDKFVLCGLPVVIVAVLVIKYKDALLRLLWPIMSVEEKLKAWLGIKSMEDIAEVKYLGTVATDSKRGGFKGALLGGFLFGPMGVPVGGLLPMGTKTRCRFVVRYCDGEVKMLDCYKGTEPYNTLMSYVRWEDL